MQTPPGPVQKPSPADTPKITNQEHCEELLDESVEETFPASDPISPSNFSVPPLQPTDDEDEAPKQQQSKQ